MPGPFRHILITTLALAILGCANRDRRRATIPDRAVVRDRTPTKLPTTLATKPNTTPNVTQRTNTSPRQPQTATTTQLIPITTRIDAVRGRTVVIELDIPPRQQQPPPKTLDLRLDDGRRIQAFIHPIDISPAALQRHPWLDPVERWSTDIAGTSPRPIYLCALELPTDAATGRPVDGLWFGSTRIALQLLADPTTITPGAARLTWDPGAARLASDLLLNQLASPERLSPARRWRHRLLIDGLAPAGDSLLGTPRRDPADPAQVLDAYAEQLEARWQVALTWLSLSRPEISQRLRTALAGAVSLDDARGVPILAGSAPETETLLDSLLTPGIAEAERAARAAAFLDALPAASVWVIDDAGRGRADSPLTTLGLINLSSTLLIAEPAHPQNDKGLPQTNPQSDPQTDQQQSREPAELTPIPARSIATLALARASREGIIDLRAANWQGRARVLREPTPVKPPGFSFGPTTLDWTMRALAAGEPDQSMLMPRDWSTAALLLRDEQGWAVLIEAATRPGDATESIELWLGPRAVSTTRVIRASIEGNATITTGTTTEKSEVAITRTPTQSPTQNPSKWSALVRVPEAAIERGNDGKSRLRLALVRIDSRGFRSAWPRPMLPWQLEPGRIVLDLSTWQ